jgi:hypothetical protein
MRFDGYAIQSTLLQEIDKCIVYIVFKVTITAPAA